MRNRSSRAAAPPSVAGGGSEGAGETAEGSEASPGAGGVSLRGEPILLRIPRGTFAGLTLGLIGVLGLTYWVGYQRGYSRAAADLATDEEAAEGVRARLGRGAAPPEEPPTRLRATIGSARIVGDEGLAARLDTRRPGMNYFVIAHYRADSEYSRSKAAELVDFLAGHGVEAAAFRHYDSKMFQVVALKGFERSGSEEARAFRGTLVNLGPIWRQDHHGADFGDGVYADLYEGETPNQAIARVPAQLTRSGR